MHPAAQVDEPVWPADQRGEDVRGEGVHGEGLRVALRRRAAGRLEEDARVMDDRIHPADLVHLLREPPGPGRAGEVADHDSRGARGKAGDRRRPLSATGMEDDVMALINEDTAWGLAEPVSGTGDKDARHGSSFPRPPPGSRPLLGCACKYSISRSREQARMPAKRT